MFALMDSGRRADTRTVGALADTEGDDSGPGSQKKVLGKLGGSGRNGT